MLLWDFIRDMGVDGDVDVGVDVGLGVRRDWGWRVVERGGRPELG